MSINGEQPKPLLINYILKIILLIIFIKYSHYILKNKEIIISDLNKGINNTTINKEINNLPEDNITLVTALFKLKSNRHRFNEYLIWIENLLQINKPIVFFIEPSLLNIIKEKRPKIYENKTIWIERNFSDLYAYKHDLKKFQETYIIDKAKFKHTVDLYIIWSEKVNFLNESIEKNYFNSKYFFWVDAGLFRDIPR